MHLSSYVLPASGDRQCVAVLELSGDVDLDERQRLIDAVDDAAAGQSTLVINLDNVRYMDSIGLSVLIRAHKMMRDRGGCFTVVAATPQIRRLVVMTGLDRLFGLHEDLDRAVRAVSAPAA